MKSMTMRIWQGIFWGLAVASSSARELSDTQRLSVRLEAQELCVMTGIATDVSWGAMLKEASQWWLRPAGKERWEFTFAFKLSDAQMERAYDIFVLLGFMAECAPKRMNYTYLVIFGATVPRMQDRIAYAIELWKRGIRWDRIALLSGDRKLDPRIDVVVSGDPLAASTETEAFDELWDRMCKDGTIPSDMQKCAVMRVMAKSTINAEGKVQRPATQDTVGLFAGSAQLGPDDSCLFISSQPYVYYQGLVVKSALRAEAAFADTVGAPCRPALTAKDDLGVLFDTLARCLYWEDKLWNTFAETDVPVVPVVTIVA